MHARHPTKTLRLHLPRPNHPLADRGARLRRPHLRNLPDSHRRHLDLQVDAVQQRARNTSHITVHRTRRAGALFGRVVVIPAGTGIHGRYEGEIGRIFHAVSRPRNHDLLILQRLPQHFEHAASEFGQLVEEQHSVVRQRHLARLGRLSAADQRHLRSHVMRRTERTLREQSPLCAQFSRHGVYLGRFQRLLDAERRQNRRHAPRQHRLTRTGRTDHQHVMSSGRRDLQRPLYGRLSFHVGEILGIGTLRRQSCLGIHRHRRIESPLPVQQGDHLAQGVQTVHFDPLHDRRFSGVFGRHHEPPQPLVPGLDRKGQHTPYGPQRSVERELAREHRRRKQLPAHLGHRGENPHGDRQVETRPLLAQIGRSEVHHDLAARHLATGILESRPDTLLALLDGVVRQSDQIESQTAPGEIDLDGHLHGVDPGNSPCIRTDEHIIDLSLYNQAIFLQLRSEFPDPHFQSGAPAANAAKPDAETGAGSAKTAPPRSDSRAPPTHRA